MSDGDYIEDDQFGRPCYEITCSVCGEKGKVPFKPRKDQTHLMCKKCHKEAKRGV